MQFSQLEAMMDLEGPKVDIEIIRMVNPGCYIIKETNIDEKSNVLFNSLMERMKTFYDRDVQGSVTPEVGQIYAGRVHDKWLRVRVDLVMKRSMGIQASCYLLDYGKDGEMIPIKSLREIPEECMRIPFQAREVYLYGIQPVTLIMNSDLTVSPGVGQKYDASASSFMKQNLKEIFQWKASFVKQDSGGRNFVRLFYVDPATSNLRCINDVLVENKYATPTTESLYVADNYPMSGNESSGSYRVSTPKSRPLSGSESPVHTSADEYGMVLRRPIAQSSSGENLNVLPQSTLPQKKRSPLGRGERLRTVHLYEPVETVGARSRGFSDDDRYSSPQSAITPQPAQSGQIMEIPSARCRLPKHAKVASVPSQRRLDSGLSNYNDSAPVVTSDSGIHDEEKVIHTNSDGFLPPSSKTYHSSLIEMSNDDENIWINGSDIKPIKDLNDSQLQFSDLMKNSRQVYCDITRPSVLQSYLWNAVRRGFDVAAIAPKATTHQKFNSLGGKTLSYLFPLLVQLNYSSSYVCLPKFSTSPYAVILCPSWEHVQCVYDQFTLALERQNLLRHYSRQLKVMMLYGGGGDENKEVQLINGCDILISTPCSLLRMLDKSVMNLDRLSHIIFEYGDELLEYFKPEVERFMNAYQLVLDQRDEGVTAPQQILLFSQRYSPVLKEFSLKYQKTPVVIITSKVEASYSGKVKHIPIECSMTNRLSHVLSIFDSKRKKAVIFASEDRTAECIHKTLQASSLYALLAHQEMSISDLQKVSEEFSLPNSNSSILVISDNAVENVNISDAAWIIHYDIPENQAIFANRLWCMRKYFEKFDHLPLEKKLDECVSYLLITEQQHVTQFCSRLMKIFERSEQDVPEFLRRLASMHEEDVGKNTTIPLCPAMKYFGYCRNTSICNKRHKIYECLDSPGVDGNFIKLPDIGRVKVRITYVTNVSSYYAELMEHRELSGKKVATYMESKRLAMNIAFYYGKQSNRQYATDVIDQVAEGQLVIWKDESSGIYYRAKVVQLLSSKQFSEPDKAKIFLVDIGRTLACVSLSKLLVLAPQFSSTVIPFQAIEVCICRIKPVDKDSEWTDLAKLYIAEKILGEVLEGNIQLSLGNTIWLDPLVKHDWLDNLKIWNEKYVVRSLVMEKNFAEENPNHMDMLYAACQGVLKLPFYMKYSGNPNQACTVKGLPITTKTESFPDCDRNTVFNVYVTAVNSPDLIYVQNAALWKDLAELNKEINQWMELNESKMEFDLKSGALVLARSPSDGRWYRGKVESCSGQDQSEIFFVDTGETEDLNRQDIAPLASNFRKLPFQAIECSLMDVVSIGDDWTEDVSNFLMDSTANEDGGTALLEAQIVTKSSARFTGEYRYGISLCDHSSKKYYVNIANQLVATKKAKLSSSRLQRLFPVDESADENNLSNKVLELCKMMLMTTDSEDRQSLANKLVNLSHRICSGKHDATNLVSVIGLALEYVWEVETTYLLLVTLKMFAENDPDHCSEMEVCVWNTLCRVLDQSHRLDGLQYGVVYILSSLLTCQRCCRTFTEYGGLAIIGSIASSAPSDDIVQYSLEIIQKVLLNTNNRSNSRGRIDCLKAAIDNLSSSDPKIINSCLDIIHIQLEQNSKIVKSVRSGSSSLIKIICQQMMVWSDIEFVNKGLKLLIRLAGASVFNREQIQTCCAQDSLELLACRNDSNRDTRLLLTDLETRLFGKKIETDSKHNAHKIRAKDPPSQQLVPIKKTESVTESRKPPVTWAQSKWNLFLTVDVKDVSSDRNVMNFTETSISLSAISMSTEFTFNYSLYELIVPEKCETRICASCIYIGLRKKSKGLWPRLCKEKFSSCPLLKPDFDRFAMDEDSGDSDDQEEPKSAFEMFLRNPANEIQMQPNGWAETLNAISANSTKKYQEGRPDDCDYGGLKGGSNTDPDYSGSSSDSDIEDSLDPAKKQDRNLGYFYC